AFSGSLAFLKDNLYLVPAITLLSSVEAVVVSVAILALSSLSNNSRFVGVLYAGLIFFTDAMYGVLRFVTGGSRLSWISVGNNLEQLGDIMFRIPPRYSTPWPISLLAIIALVAVAARIL